MISFLRDIDFEAVAKRLNLNIHRAALPTSASCPLCKHGRMKFLQDRMTGGAFFICDKCEQQGDIIDLLERLWATDTPSVLFKLRDHNLLQVSSFDVTSCISQRAAHLKSLRKGQRVYDACMNPGLLDEVKTTKMLERLGIKVPSRFAMTSNYCPQIFGCASGSDMGAAIRNLSKGKTSSTATRDNFRPALAMPFYDLPGRVVAVSVVDRVGSELKLTEVRHRINYGKYHDDGVACHPSLFADKSSGSLLVTPHAYLAAIIWARAAMQNYYQIPLLVAKQDTHSWHLFGRRSKTVIAVGASDVDAIRLAAKLNAALFLLPRGKTIEDSLARTRIAELQRKAQRTKRPWTTVLSNHLATLEADDAVAYLHKLQLPEDELIQLRDADTHGNRKLIDSYRADSTGYKSLVHRSGVIEQRDGGWYYTVRGRTDQVANAAVSIKQLSRFVDQTVASVFVSSGDREISFQVDYDVLQDNFFRVVHNACLQHDFYFNSPTHWRTHLHAIAGRFYQPTIHDGIGFVGYDNRKREWNTPSHVIKHGKILRKPAIPDWLQLPGNMKPTWKGWRSYVRKAPPVVIATIIAALDQVLARAAGRPKQPVYFSGPATMMAVQQISQALSTEDNNSSNHDWITIEKKLASGGKAVNARSLSSAFVNKGWLLTSDVQRCYGAFKGGVALSDEFDPLYVPKEEHIGYIAATFLYLMKNWNGETDTVQYVLNQLSDVLTNPVKVQQRVTTKIDTCLAFVLLLKEIQNRGMLVFGDEALSTKRSLIIRKHDNGKDAFIPTQIVEKAMSSMHLGTFEVLRIVQRLSISPHYRSFDSFRSSQGWLIDWKLVERVFKDAKLQVGTFQLRVVG